MSDDRIYTQADLEAAVSVVRAELDEARAEAYRWQKVAEIKHRALLAPSPAEGTGDYGTPIQFDDNDPPPAPVSSGEAGDMSNVSDADFEEQRRVAAEAAGLVRVGTTDDGRGIYADRPFKSPTWDEIVMRVNAQSDPAPVVTPSASGDES